MAALKESKFHLVVQVTGDGRQEVDTAPFLEPESRNIYNINFGLIAWTSLGTSLIQQEEQHVTWRPV